MAVAPSAPLTPHRTTALTWRRAVVLRHDAHPPARHPSRHVPDGFPVGTGRVGAARTTAASKGPRTWRSRRICGGPQRVRRRSIPMSIADAAKASTAAEVSRPDPALILAPAGYPVLADPDPHRARRRPRPSGDVQTDRGSAADGRPPRPDPRPGSARTGTDAAAGVPVGRLAGLHRNQK